MTLLLGHHSHEPLNMVVDGSVGTCHGKCPHVQGDIEIDGSCRSTCCGCGRRRGRTLKERSMGLRRRGTGGCVKSPLLRAVVLGAVLATAHGYRQNFNVSLQIFPCAFGVSIEQMRHANERHMIITLISSLRVSGINQHPNAHEPCRAVIRPRQRWSSAH